MRNYYYFVVQARRARLGKVRFLIDHTARQKWDQDEDLRQQAGTLCCPGNKLHFFDSNLLMLFSCF